MLKMFTTQLTGVLQRINEQEELVIEDGARLLAQAASGQGNIYIMGFNETKSVELEALHGAEPLTSAKQASDLSQLTEADRVLLVSRSSTDPEAVALAEQLIIHGIPFVAIAGASSAEESSLQTLADVFIDTKITRGLIPDDHGNRVIFPSSLASLYIYFALKFNIDEILEENL